MSILTVGAADTGAAFRTIRDAVEAAVEEDVIVVRSGIYDGVKLNKRALKLIAADGHLPIIDGGWNGKTVEGDFGGTIACQADGVWVEGFIVRNCPGRGIGVSADHVTVRGNRIDNCYKGGFGANAPAEKKFLTGLTVEHNVITRAGQERIVTKGGKVNGSLLVAQVQDSVIRRNVVASVLGEAINIDRGSERIVVDGNLTINSAHVHIYINRASRIVVKNNVCIHTGDPKPVGDKDDAPSGIIIGDENGDWNRVSSFGNVITGNVVIGCGKLFMVRNNAHNYDTTLDDETQVLGNSFIAGPQTTRGIDILPNVQGHPHGAALFARNVIEFTEAAATGVIGRNSSSRIQFEGNAWSEQPPASMRSETDVVGDLLLINPGVELHGDWATADIEGFDLNNYRPQAGSPLISEDMVIGALAPLSFPPPDPPDDPPPDDPEWVSIPLARWEAMIANVQSISATLDRLSTELDATATGLTAIGDALQQARAAVFALLTGE